MTQITELPNKILGAIIKCFNEQLQMHLKQMKNKRKSAKEHKVTAKIKDKKTKPTEILEPENTIPEIKMSMDELSSRKRQGKESMNLKTATEITQPERQRENRLKNK